MKPTLILTRPRLRNESLARRLEGLGCPVLSLPALELAPCAPSGDALPRPEDFDLVVFVSSFAARVYLDALKSQHAGDHWPAHTVAATVGAASARPLYDAGWIPASAILHPDASLASQDSEALWALLQARSRMPRRVLVLRGQDGREWLGQRLEQAGARVKRLALYARRPLVWDATQAQAVTRAMTSGTRAIILLTSSDSTRALSANVGRHGLGSAFAASHFLVIHSRIAHRLQSILVESGWGEPAAITLCAPDEDAIVRSIQSLVASTSASNDYNHCHD